jgi:hypothetical protein
MGCVAAIATKVRVATWYDWLANGIEAIPPKITYEAEWKSVLAKAPLLFRRSAPAVTLASFTTVLS